MGWGSAGYAIFDPVIKAMIEAECPEYVITKVAGVLVDTLTDQDWDTVDESVEEFRDVPAVAKALNERGYWSLRQFEPDQPVTIRCRGCDRMVEYKLGPDGDPISWVHAMLSGQVPSNDVCPYSGKGPDGH